MNPIDAIMNELEESTTGGGGGGPKPLWISHSGKTGFYSSKEKRDDSNPLAGIRGAFEAVVLYCPMDSGRALWPDGRRFTGTQPICQSERSASPYDRARLGKDLSSSVKSELASLGRTGTCHNCPIGTDICKPRLVAYILDLEHYKEVQLHNQSLDAGDELLPIRYSKLDAKGPQSFFNFLKCYKALYRKSRDEGKSITDYIVRFASEPGSNGSKKVTFEPVGLAKGEFAAIVNVLAGEAYAAAQRVWTPSATSPAREQPQSDGVAVDDFDEVPF